MKILQKTNDFRTDEIKGSVMHGHTSIILKNVKTGLVDRIESDNVFQSSVLAKHLRGFGEFDANPYGSSGFNGRTLWQNLVGGLFLFRDQITEGTEYMPAGNIMIGQGSVNTSNGSTSDDPSEMGSWNAAESSATRNAITQVYDFTTSQANGTIGCVCLTSRMGGLIGYGNSGNVKGYYNMYTDQTSRNVIGDSHNICYNNEVWSCNGIESGILSFTVTRISATYGSVFSGYTRTVSFDLSVVGNPYNISSGGGFHLTDCGSGIVRFVIAHSRGTDSNSPKQVSPGGTLYYYELNCSAETLTLKTLTNSTDKTLYNSHASWNYDYWNCDVNDRYYYSISTNGDYAYFLDLTNSTVVTSFSVDGYSYLSRLPKRISNGLYSLNRQLYDSANNTFKNFGVDSGADGFPCMQLGVLSRDGVVIHNPLYLATINNLDNAVTKTAAQTMKVTYTLTEESE